MSLNDLLFKSNTRLNKEELDKRMRAIHDRLSELEQFAPDWQAEVNALRTVGLDRINTALLPAYQSIIDLADLGALWTASSETEVEIGTGQKAFTLPDPDRQRFAPPVYTLIAAGDDFANAMTARLVSYDRELGELVVDVQSFVGSGTFSDWTIGPIATSDDLEALRDQVQSAASTATDAKNTAVSAKNTAVTASTNAIAALATFNGVWLGSQASDPTVDLNGNALTGGEMYFSSVALVAKVYDIATETWYPISQPVSPVSNGYIGDGDTAGFTLSIAPAHKNLTLVYIDGVYQNKDQYSVAGTALTFTSAPASGAKVEVITLVATDIGTPSNNTVGPDQLNDAEKPEIRGFLELDLLRGENAIINGNFDFWQYGTSIVSSTSASFLADRWFHNTSGSTYSASRQEFTEGQTDVPGNPRYFLRHSVSVGNDFAGFLQRIEGVDTFAGETATITAYVKGVNPGGGAVYCYLYQTFGTGGSPSVAVVVEQDEHPIVLTSSWQKISFTIDVPSMDGKTIGTDGNDALWLIFSQASDTSTDAWEMDISRVSMVLGDATGENDPYPRRSKQQELAACQRYFEKSYLLEVAPGTVTGNGKVAANFARNTSNQNYEHVPFKQTKRSVPTMTLYSAGTGAAGKYRNDTVATDYNARTPETGEGAFNGAPDSATDVALGSVWSFHWTASAEL